MTRAPQILRGLFVCLSLLLLAGMAPSAAAQSFVQVNYATPASGAQVGVMYTKAQIAGDLNVVVVGWNDTTAAIKSVSDSQGNVYVLAVGPTAVSGNLTQSIYYAKNIVAASAGANTVTVVFNTSAIYPDIRILEYSGLDTNSPFDGGTGAVGTATTADSGALATTNANDLLVGANIVLTSTTGAGTGYTSRTITYPDGDIAEDEVVAAKGSYHATSILSGAGSWIMQVVAFKAAGAAPAPSAPTNLAAAVISSNQISLSWTASTESGATISSYLVERCQGAGCTSFAQIGTSASTAYNDASLAASTTYSYRVRAEDTSNNIGPYSSVVTATTQSSTIPTPTAPGSLTAAAGASGPIVIAVQEYKNSTSLISHTTAAFNSTGGDVIVMCASSHAGVTMTPSDSFGNSWISIAGPTSTTVGDDLRTQVWYARNPTVGPGQTVTMTMSAAQPLVISVIVAKGSLVSSPIDATSTIGSDNGTQTTNVVSPNITTTNSYDLLIGFAKSAFDAVWGPGNGFTAQPGASSTFLFAETGLAATPGVYDATFGIGGNLTWQAVVTSVSPSAAAASANQVNLAWTASTETGGTVSGYLVERCQGSGCTTFSQIGTSSNTTYTDTAISPSTSFTYRVRAIDTNNNVSAYSNTATVTTPAGSAPAITILSPISGAPGTSVTITGSNFGATQGASTVTFGATAVTPISWSATSIVVPVPNSGTAGTVAVVVTVGGVASNSVNFTVTPTIVSLNPTSGPVGTSVTITGADFGSSQNVSNVTFSGISAGTATSWSATSITVVVPSGATTGPVVVTIGGVAILSASGGTFTVTVPPPPSITSLSTASGPAGTPVTITGGNFGATQGTSTVKFNGVSAGTANSWSASSITVNVPSGAATGNVIVTVGGQVSNGVAFTVAPSISSLSPTTGPGNISVTIAGNGFGATQGTSAVTFGGIAATPISWSATSIVVPVPNNGTAGTVTVFVTVGGVASNSVNFTVTPIINTLNPTSGLVGTSVTVAGTNFGASQGSSTVTFNGTAATPTSWNTTSIVVPVPTGATTGNVVVTVGGQASNGVSFTVTPSITSLNPTSGPVGTSVTITGTNFGSIVGTVTFNGVPVNASYTWTPTSISVQVPAGATTGNVVVTVNGVASNGMAFTVVVPPNITSLSPASGTSGTSVTITGSGFGATQGTSTVSFNGSAATPTSWSATTIVVPVPAVQGSGGGASTGPVTVTVGGATSNGVVFTVLPSILPSGVSPTSGPVGTTVTIIGNGFGGSQGSSTVTFNGVPAVPTFWSGNEIMAVVPNGASTGNVVVTVGGVPSNGSTFTVAPSISSITPSTVGPTGTPVTITGNGFGNSQGSSTVSFGGIAATPTSWSASSVVVPVPNVAVGTQPVVVTVGGIASNAVNFTVTPSITGLSPSSGPVSTSVTITGGNFGASQGTSTVKFNGTAATPTSWSTTSITAPVPTGATSGSVIVTVGGQASNGVTFTVTVPAPLISTLTPASGPVGTSVIIAGSNFGATQGTSTVSFSGTAATPTSWSTASITAPVPTGASSGSVTVMVGGQTSNGLTFTVTVPSPIISSLTPASGPIGTSVTIAGSNFGATQGTSTIKFNGTTATPTSWSTTSITAPVPTGATSGSVTVTVGGQTSNGISFTVTIPAPIISSLTPASGPVGTSVTIAGSNFGATQGTSTVSFNGTTATPTSWSTTSISAPVPTGASSGSVTVTVGGQASNGVAFTVTTGSSTPTAPGNLTAVASTLAPIIVSEQGYINSTSLTTHVMSSFDSTGGDLLVLFASSHAGVTFTPSDSFGNVWTSAAGPTSTTVGFDLRSQIWYARNPTVGPNHTITMNLSASQPLVMSILVVKGSNISNPIDVVSPIGSDNGSLSVNIASPGITTAAANELLIGFSKVSASSVFQAGTGFTQQTTASSNYLDAEVGLASAPAIYSATFSVGAQVTWQAVAAAVTPAVASNPNQVNLSWTASTETGGTISSYLIERCQGSGCSNFVQVATSTTTTYSDTGLTAATTYNYRARAKDNSGNVGPYSNTATITTPSGVPIPNITSLSPTFGPIGTSVTILGANFGATQGTSSVSFNGTLATPTNWSATSITVPVPTGATSGSVTVTVGGQVSSGVAFSVTLPAPVISSLLPTWGPVGTSVTITGSNFGATQGTSTVSFNGTPATPSTWSASSITVPVPTGATSGNVTVSVGGQTSNGVLFTVGTTPPAGTITHLQQASNYDVSGTSHTSFSATLPTATTIGSAIIVGVTYGNVNPTITATDSQGNSFTKAVATYDAVHSQGCAILYAVSTKGNTTDTVTVNFSGSVAYLGMGIHEYSGVAGASALDTTTGSVGSSASPTSGLATTTANGDLIFGCAAEDSIGSGDTFTAGSGFTKRVDLGIAAAYADEDGVQAAAGSIASTWTLSPSSGWVTSMAAFKSASGATAATITNLSPTSGPVGTSVTITGTNFGATQGTNTVKFNGTTATPTSWSATSIVVPVPTGATTGSVVVTVGGVASNGSTFTVTP